MANGTIHKLGTLIVNGTQYAMPTNPIEGGNCVSANTSNFTVGDTVAGKELQWIEWTKADGTKMLVCDRGLIVNISWNSINAAGFITGKEITIDGQKYKMRSLTGSNGSSGSYGAGCNNEWDQFLDAVGEEDSLVHWNKMYSWCQDVWYSNSDFRSVRGHDSARYYDYSDATNSGTLIAFRPALEVLNSAPKVSPSSKDYGSCATAPDITVTVTDDDGDAYTGVVKVDGVQKSTFSGTASGSHKLPTADWWASISKAKHTITVTVTDANNASTTTTYTFTKTNGPAAKATITSPVQNQRRKTSFYVEFKPGADPDGDTQTVKVQMASNTGFSQNLKEYTSLQIQTDGTWSDATNVTAANVGKTCRIKVTGQTAGTVRYVRVVSTDTGSKLPAYSTAVKVAIGDVLEFTTLPEEWSEKPDRIDVKIKATVDEAATMSLWVSNNANDANPTWEAYELGAYHIFENNEKTADKWATAVKVKITAGESTGEISVSDIATGVL